MQKRCKYCHVIETDRKRFSSFTTSMYSSAIWGANLFAIKSYKIILIRCTALQAMAPQTKTLFVLFFLYFFLFLSSYLCCCCYCCYYFWLDLNVLYWNTRSMLSIMQCMRHVSLLCRMSASASKSMDTQWKLNCLLIQKIHTIFTCRLIVFLFYFSCEQTVHIMLILRYGYTRFCVTHKTTSTT